MKLSIRVREDDGRRWLALCDDLGNPLPNQAATTLTQTAEGRSTLGVLFIIDGDDVRLDAGAVSVDDKIRSVFERRAKGEGGACPTG